MAFSISTHDLPRINSYERAKRWFESYFQDHPHRHQELGAPLVGDFRRFMNKRITKGPDYYAAQLYDTEVVKWFSDGRVEVDVRYGTPSTHRWACHFAADIWHVSSSGVQFGSDAVVGGRPIPKRQLVACDSVFRYSLTPFTIELDRSTFHEMQWDRLNKKAAAAARKKVKPVAEVLKVVCSAGNKAYTPVWTRQAQRVHLLSSYLKDPSQEKFGEVIDLYMCDNYSEAIKALNSDVYIAESCYETIVAKVGEPYPRDAVQVRGS